MASGTNDGAVIVHARVEGRNFGQLEGGTSVAWLVCDTKGCHRYMIRADSGDESLLCAEAEAEGWHIGAGSTPDACPDHAPRTAE